MRLSKVLATSSGPGRRSAGASRRGITGGCTATQYCPNSSVTRSQMAVFVVKSMEACPTLAANDEMIRVGGVCIDKYEASLWDHPTETDPSHLITGAIPCNANGQDCTSIYARSVAGTPDVPAASDEAPAPRAPHSP